MNDYEEHTLSPDIYTNFLTALADMKPEDPWYEAATIHLSQLPKGELWFATPAVADDMTVLIRDIRLGKTATDRNLREATGTQRIDFGPAPWFCIFGRAVDIDDIGGKSEMPLAAIAWAPEELALIGPTGDTCFLHWPRGTSAASRILEDDDYKAVAPWLMAAAIFNGIWGATEREVAGPPAGQSWPAWVPARGIRYMQHRGDGGGIFVDGDTQWS
jgi:hypothetical protein